MQTDLKVASDDNSAMSPQNSFFKDQKFLENIPILKIDEDDTECKICFEFMAEPCTLYCNHRFCIQCI